MKSPKGYLCMVLHAHLPFVRHPEHEYFLEERWLYEAITESYIPLLQMSERLHQDRVYFRFSLSISPPLLGMLSDSLLQKRYERHLLKLIELSEKEIHRTQKTAFHSLARMYHQHFQDCLKTWKEYDGNLIEGFLKFSKLGSIEIFTTTATHAFLPAFRVYPEAVKAQIRIGMEHHRSVFGERAKGMWLPECGYFPGLEKILAEEGVQFFFVERHGLEYATPLPFHGVYAPIYTPQGVAVFGRDPLSSEQVWSSEVGYPGDPCYREFYRDIGYDLDFEYIKPYIHPDGIRLNTGIKYHAITGKTNLKAVYNRREALKKTLIHGEDFLRKNLLRLERVAPDLEIPPLVVSPYDAELFGHWWFEGPDWMEALFRLCHSHFSELQPITPSEYLKIHSTHQVALPATSTWGKKGYGEVWVNQENAWIYPHLLHATKEMIRMAEKHHTAEGPLQNGLNQAARELLLAQSSDWPFLIHTKTAPSYAEKRVKIHLSRFLKIIQDLEQNELEPEWLKAMEYLDNIFPNLNYKVFSQALPRSAKV